MSNHNDQVNQGHKGALKGKTALADRVAAHLQYVIATAQAMRDASNAPGYTLAQAQAAADAMIANMKAQVPSAAADIVNGVN